jgi:MYXO-CTERM domain-containing protein
VTDKTTTTDKSRGKDLKQLPTGNDGCGCTVSATSNEWPLTLFFFLLLPLFWRRRR